MIAFLTVNEKSLYQKPHGACSVLPVLGLLLNTDTTWEISRIE